MNSSSNDIIQGGTRNKATSAQLSYLAEFMRTHGDMASGFGQNLQGRVELERAWEKLSGELNALGGSTKTAAKWKQTWRDLRNSVKKKASHNRAEYRGCGTGNGPPTLNSMSPVEEQVLSIIGPVATFGLEIVESGTLPPPPLFMDDKTTEGVVPRPSITTGPSPTPSATPPPRKKRKRISKPTENLEEKLLKLKEEELRVRVEELEVKREKNVIMNSYGRRKDPAALYYY